MLPIKRTLTVKNYTELLDTLPTSGLFEMTDCAVEIWCPEFTEVEEIQRMVFLLESMVHVTDVKIGSDIENLTSSDYRVVLVEKTVNFSKRLNKGKD
jgi:hypothetical protein